eukprot:940053-Prorocentrum_lima.AAC.1
MGLTVASSERVREAGASERARERECEGARQGGGRQESKETRGEERRTKRTGRMYNVVPQAWLKGALPSVRD